MGGNVTRMKPYSAEAVAAFNAAMVFRSDETVEFDKDKYLSLLHRAEELGHTGAMIELAQYVYDGYDNQRAFDLYQKAANLGDPDGVMGLIKYYEPPFKPDFEPEDFEDEDFDDEDDVDDKAFSDDDVLSDEQDDDTDIEIDENFRQMMDEAAREYVYGHPGFDLERDDVAEDETRPVEPDEKKIIELYHQAVEMGHPEAITTLAFMYQPDDFYDMDDENVDEEEPDKTNLGDSKTGDKSELGTYGIVKDIHKTIEILNKGVALDQEEAIIDLAFIYLFNEEIDSRLELAVDLLSRSSVSHNPRAIGLLAECYMSGHGIAENTERGLELLHQAADGDDILASQVLGLLYAVGECVTRDVDHARRIFYNCDIINQTNLEEMFGQFLSATDEDLEAMVQAAEQRE